MADKKLNGKYVSVGTIGHVDHSKLTLVKAINRVLSMKCDKDLKQNDTAKREKPKNT